MKTTTPTTTARTVAITGCSRGLGRAAAESFIARGARVAGCARSETAVAELNERHGAAGHFFAVADVRDDRAMADFAREAVERLGAPGLLLNNAALINPNAPLWEVPAAEFDAVIDVNLKGVANAIRHFVPPMIARGSGVIVNLSSGWGRSTSPEVAPYCATKWGVEGLTAALAQELPRGLAAVALNPGIIDTDMLRSCFGESAGAYGDADDWARRAVPFLEALGVKDNGKALTAP
ncbi:MAG: SDR family oxidoreductase [Verrucomicrobiae bacterium]|nr:SDR family oxidoreductase [Verrucomicrobiae bacterium]MCP5539268.1 SDR family oxidoreductase [Akkermansiaceae bacterium]